MLSDVINMTVEMDGYTDRLNALSSIVCFLTMLVPTGPGCKEGRSQCPLEHCMLSDPALSCLARTPQPMRLNALSSIVCFLTKR